ncbi:uncharacterized protein LOC127750461 [Frankliniella occidentalis]|uniref:Uncharacterized protein LOC127750461 n=1 Tax=Frankliniella occidentalis TaxID=133901 RepID=A0A9C6X2W8_FRAOC|nr:uncharacterized protein LOC127750461 [Frankliniella occidentalis]
MRTAMVSLVIGVLVLVVTTKRAPRPGQSTKLMFQWLDIVECPELKGQNLSVVLRYNKNGDVYADTEWNVVNAAKKLVKLRQSVSSCRDDGTNCEHFVAWDFKDGCAFIANRNAIWSPCFSNIRPPFLCPVAAVHYVNKNFTIDKEILNALPFPRGRVYKDRLEMWNEKEELTYCIILSFTWKYVAIRD